MISIVVISKDEPALDQTLTEVQAQAADSTEEVEVVVVDASARRLAELRARHPQVQWIDFPTPPGTRITIPHQRNCGVDTASGEVIVFVDAGCLPRDGWLARLVKPIREEGEQVIAGLAVAPAGTHSHYQLEVERVRGSRYLAEAPTLNLAFTRDVFAAVGGFDETFEYGSDLDFTWRVVDNGFRIRSEPSAVVEHDWGTPRRQLRRAYHYGRAKARLYRKHASRRERLWRKDPVVIAYPVFLLGLPLTLLFPAYPLLLLVPLWRNRRYGGLTALADHLAHGAGILAVTFEQAVPQARAAAPV